MYSVMRTVDPAALDRAGVRLVILSNGSPSMIKSYRRMYMQCPHLVNIALPSGRLSAVHTPTIVAASSPPQLLPPSFS